jgi:hypothetical protein
MAASWQKSGTPMCLHVPYSTVTLVTTMWHTDSINYVCTCLAKPGQITITW